MAKELKELIGTDIKPSQSEDVYQATVYTWGVKPNKHKLTLSSKVKLFGGNIGHASMSITFPADERGKQLIQTYCISANIPYKKILKKNNSGEIKNTHITLAPLLFITRSVDNNSVTTKEVNEILNKLEEISSKIKLDDEEIYNLKIYIEQIEKSKNPLAESQYNEIYQKKRLLKDKQKQAFQKIIELNKIYRDGIKRIPELNKYVTIGKTPDSKISLPIVDASKKIII